MMESSAKTSSSDRNAFISTAHLLPNSTATYWIAPHHFAAAPPPMFCPQSTAFALNLNNGDELEDQFVGDTNAAEKTDLRDQDEIEMEIPKLALFEKPLTPSDVGKLNRLVIPKQHAEKYFPLNGGADSGESGMLLSFEDELGKSWRFRYSYWNSSQSYVLTKGWSRFVKEKRLDAGDVVVFARHRADAGRLFIGWRRRNSGGAGDDATIALAPPAAGWNRAFHPGTSNYGYQHQLPPSLPHQKDFSHQIAGSVVQSQAASVSGNSKTLRLFGVNLECLAADEPEPRSSQHQPQPHPYHQYYPNHMDTTFSGAEDAYRHHHQG